LVLMTALIVKCFRSYLICFKPLTFMFTPAPYIIDTDYRQLAFVIISVLLIAFGFRYIKDIIVFVLDQLYRLFIQENPIL